MPHQKLLLIMIRVGLITTITTLGWNFPLQEVSQPSCRGTQRDQLNEDCKIDIVAGSQQEDMGKLLFSALRGTSYDTPFTQKSGGHPSLDMPSAEGTPVYAINDGEVTHASEMAGYGLSITVKHTIGGEIIFSNYSHLSEMLVKKGDIVKANTVIGKVGCTGFSISGDPSRCGFHLDFQITTNKSPSHPYGYGDCKEGQYYEAVAEGLCADKLKEYTIDPLVFFAKNTDLTINYPLIAPYIVTSNQKHSAAPSESKKKTTLESIFARLRAQNSAIIGLPTSTTTVIAQQTPSEEVKTQEESLAANIPVEPTTPTSPATRKQATIDIGTIHWLWNQDLNDVTSYKVITLSITISDKLGNTFIGTLPQSFKVTIDNSEVASFFPAEFNTMSTEKKHLFLQTRKQGKAALTLRYGDTKIAEEQIIVR